MPFAIWETTPHLCGYALRDRRDPYITHCYHNGCWDERQRLAAMAYRKLGYTDIDYPLTD